MTDPRLAALAQRAPQWVTDPTTFCRDVLGFTPWERQAWGHRDSQADFIRAACRSRRVAWRAGHKVGKSWAVAGLALWAWTWYPDARVVLTAPSWRQVNEVVWRAVRQLHQSAARRGFDLGGHLYDTPAKGLVGPDGRQLFGFSTDEKDRFSGISGGNVFYFVDEASGVDDGIFEAIEGAAAGGAWVILTGNPTRTEGGFYRAFHEEAELWRCLHTSSEETPNVGDMRVAEIDAPDFPQMKGIARREYIERARQLWTPHDTHPLYGIRVRGEFPSSGATSVISLKHVTEATRRWAIGDAGRERLYVGVDVARFGDDSNCVALRRGKRILSLTSFANMDSIQVAGKVRELVRAAMTTHEMAGLGEKPCVLVDVIGVGAGVYDQLAQFKELDVLDVNVARASDDDDAYHNLRSQLWFGVDSWLGDGGEIPDNAELRGDLLAPQYSFDNRGRQKVEPKQDIKERIGRSTDSGDAVCLAVYAGGHWRSGAIHVSGL